MTIDSFVVDANVVNALQQAHIGADPDVSADPVAAFDYLISEGHRIVLDEDGHVRQEWKECVDPDWFENWFFTLVAEANVVMIPPRRDPTLEKKLWIDCGFPRTENIWLVRTATAQACASGHCALLTEDMDFREPRKKRAGARVRARYLSGEVTGPVTRLLKKFHIGVLSLLQLGDH